MLCQALSRLQKCSVITWKSVTLTSFPTRERERERVDDKEREEEKKKQRG